MRKKVERKMKPKLTTLILFLLALIITSFHPNSSAIFAQRRCTNQVISQGNYRTGLEWTTTTNYRLVFQPDGNLVLYDNSWRALWATGTERRADTLSVQDDGNVVLYSGNQAIWNTRTQGNGRTSLILQCDGNLVVYDSNRRPLWASNTDGDRQGSTIGQDRLIGSPQKQFERFTESEYLERLYGTSFNAVITRGDKSNHVKSIDSQKTDRASAELRAFIGGEVTFVRDGKIIEKPFDKNRKCTRETERANDAVIIYNKDLDKQFIYYHFASISVREGQTVSAGEGIGFEGTTGCSTGRHTHVQVNNGRGKEQRGGDEHPYDTLGKARQRGLI